jgi:hypothetical protein
MNSWLISFAVACVVIVSIFGFAGLMTYLNKTLTAEQKEKISEIAQIVLGIIAFASLLLVFTLCAHTLLFDLWEVR